MSPMTTVYPTTADERRFAKALHIAADAASWTTLRADAGATVYRIPSQSEPGLSYETDGRGCSCPDYLGRLERGGPAPTYAEVYGSGRGHDAATCRLTICPDC